MSSVIKSVLATALTNGFNTVVHQTPTKLKMKVLKGKN